MLAFTPSAGGPHPLATAWERVEPDRLWWASAFASETGVDQLGRLLGDTFGGAQKTWLVGVDRGVTQPGALAALLDLACSAVRVPYGEETLAAPGLAAGRVFHPKACCFANEGSGEVAIVSTSGNLTHGGLVANDEQWLAWTGTRDDAEAIAFMRWWARRWSGADPASGSFVRRYADLRPRLPLPRPSQVASEPADAELRRADWLWVELVKLPHGGSFNQLELMLNAHAFFFPHGVQGSIELLLTFEGASGAVFDAPGRKVRYHGGAAGNKMWRVNLPTHHEGLDGYQDGDVLVRFTRTAVADRYRLDVVPARGPAALDWLGRGKVASPATKPPRRMGWGATHAAPRARRRTA